MKFNLKICVCAIAVFMFFSCEEKGPKSRFEMVERTSEEVIQDMMVAQENDTYYYKGRVELWYRDDTGNWHSYGMMGLYTYASYDHIYFDGLMVRVNSANGKYGYRYCVQYGGTMFYFGN